MNQQNSEYEEPMFLIDTETNPITNSGGKSKGQRVTALEITFGRLWNEVRGLKSKITKLESSVERLQKNNPESDGK